ncbi:MAG: enoyl-CoA hydratase/isomerase family protein [Acidimicrobiia bacterium]
MITYDVDGQAATITIDDPERRNPITNEAARDLERCIRRSATDDDVSVVVVTGAGEKAFSAGGDLSSGFVDDPLGDHDERSALADVFRAIQQNPKPVVARVNGIALGGGFGVAVACDITVASEDAKLGTPEIDLGLWPMLISAVLVRAMPRKALLDMMLTGRIVGASEALDLGLVTRVVPRHDLDQSVTSIVTELQNQSPAALAFGKQAFYAMADMDMNTALDHLHNGLTAVAMTEDAREGVSAFLNRRAADWSGK